MSDLIVEVSRIDEIQSHPNADKLEMAVIRGWQCVVPKGKYSVGDEIIYIPPDAVIPAEMAENLGISNYLGSGGKVKVIKLRGEVSFGLVIDNTTGLAVGTDVASLFGITKWEPPASANASSFGGAKKSSLLGWFYKFMKGLYYRYILGYRPHLLNDSELFHKYTDIQNIRNFKNWFQDGEFVYVTEKLHGTNSRVGFVYDDGSFCFMVGSHNKRRRIVSDDFYSYPLLSVSGVKELLKHVQKIYNACSVILFGEIYGGQDLKYGRQTYDAYAAFDISVNGKYLDYADFEMLCSQFKVPIVPLLYFGEFSWDKMQELSQGVSEIDGANHIREGIGIK